MTSLPLALYRGQEVKKLDSLAIVDEKLSGYQLMCRAGMSALACLKEHFPIVKEITIFCGKGNNGGDGFVLARLAKEQGLKVNVFDLRPPNETSPIEAEEARRDWQTQGGKVSVFTGEPLQGDLIVDALLGTGAKAPLPAEMLNAIKAINQSGIPVLAIDLPSGLQADTGMNLGEVVKAKLTDNEQDDVMHACEYGGVAYVTTD